MSALHVFPFCRNPCPIKPGTISGRVHRPLRVSQNDERLLAISLPANDPHPWHIPLLGPQIRPAEPRRHVSLGHGPRHVQSPHH